MRIIAGTAKGTPLKTPEGAEMRPTLERVKENYFNAINFDVENAKVLDLFAGSGQLGLEALSRGAKEAVFVDSSAECCEIIKINAQKSKLYEKCNILKYDYAEYLSLIKKRVDPVRFDIIFIDPPYGESKKIINDALKRIIKNELISENGLLICETGGGEKLALDFNPDISEKIKNGRIYKYGRIYITILTIGGSRQ